MAYSPYSPNTTDKEQKWFEAFRRYIIPAAGVAEAIVSKGQSPGNAAFNAEKIFQTQEDRRRQMLRDEEALKEAAINRAINKELKEKQSALYTSQASEYERKTAEERAKRERYNDLKESLMNPELTTDERKELVENFAMQEDPIGYIGKINEMDKLFTMFGLNRAAAAPGEAREEEKLRIAREEADRKKEAEERANTQREYTIGNISSSIDNLLSYKDLPVGANLIARGSSILPGSKYKDWKVELEYVKNSLLVMKRGELSGQGPISDSETRMLGNAIGKLNDPNISESSFREELKRIKSYLNKISSNESSGSGSGGGKKFTIESVE